MRLLAIDYGTKRLGLALSDPEGRMALPHGIIEKSTNEKLVSDLLALMREKGVEAVILGLPLGLESQETLTTRQARNFARTLEKACGLPVHLVDERLSSAEAEQRLREAGVSAKRMKKILDAEAAAVILESYLAQHQAGGGA